MLQDRRRVQKVLSLAPPLEHRATICRCSAGIGSQRYAEIHCLGHHGVFRETGRMIRSLLAILERLELRLGEEAAGGAARAAAGMLVP